MKTFSILLRVSQKSSGKAQEPNSSLPTPSPGTGLKTSFHTQAPNHQSEVHDFVTNTTAGLDLKMKVSNPVTSVQSQPVSNYTVILKPRFCQHQDVKTLSNFIMKCGEWLEPDWNLGSSSVSGK